MHAQKGMNESVRVDCVRNVRASTMQLSRNLVSDEGYAQALALQVWPFYGIIVVSVLATSCSYANLNAITVCPVFPRAVVSAAAADLCAIWWNALLTCAMLFRPPKFETTLSTRAMAASLVRPLWMSLSRASGKFLFLLRLSLALPSWPVLGSASPLLVRTSLLLTLWAIWWLFDYCRAMLTKL